MHPCWFHVASAKLAAGGWVGGCLLAVLLAPRGPGHGPAGCCPLAPHSQSGRRMSFPGAPQELPQESSFICRGRTVSRIEEFNRGVHSPRRVCGRVVWASPCVLSRHCVAQEPRRSFPESQKFPRGSLPGAIDHFALPIHLLFCSFGVSPWAK